MKVLIVLLAFAVMIQVSLAGAIERIKRSDARDDFKVYYTKLKQWMEQAEGIVRAVVNDIPTTNEYSEHKKNLEDFLVKYENQKDKFDGCLANLHQITRDMTILYRPFEQDDAPAEVKEIQQLFYKHGLKEVEDDAKEFFKTFDMKAMRDAVESWTPEKKKEMLDKCTVLNM